MNSGSDAAAAATRGRRPSRLSPSRRPGRAFVEDLEVAADSFDTDVQGVDRFEACDEDGERQAAPRPAGRRRAGRRWQAAQPRTTTGTSTIRAVPRDAMVARSAVNSLSVRLMTGLSEIKWHRFGPLSPGNAGRWTQGRAQIVIVVRSKLLQLQIVCYNADTRNSLIPKGLPVNDFASVQPGPGYLCCCRFWLRGVCRLNQPRPRRATLVRHAGPVSQETHTQEAKGQPRRGPPSHPRRGPRPCCGPRSSQEAQAAAVQARRIGALVPDIRAEAAIIYDPETGQVLWEQNSQDQRSIASITKVMTAARLPRGRNAGSHDAGRDRAQRRARRVDDLSARRLQGHQGRPAAPAADCVGQRRRPRAGARLAAGSEGFVAPHEREGRGARSARAPATPIRRACSPPTCRRRTTWRG